MVARADARPLSIWPLPWLCSLALIASYPVVKSNRRQPGLFLQTCLAFMHGAATQPAQIALAGTFKREAVFCAYLLEGQMKLVAPDHDLLVDLARQRMRPYLALDEAIEFEQDIEIALLALESLRLS